MPLTLSYLDLEPFHGQKDGEMEDGSAVSIVDRLVREANLTAGSLAHTCLRTTAGFSWYRKANRQKARGELDLPFHHLSMELLTKCPGLF
jgi:hypothetical protein